MVYVDVKALKVSVEVALVEWTGATGLQRGYVPPAAILTREGQTTCLEQDLAAAAPYGIDWEVLPTTLSMVDLPSQLRAAGIWTAEDVQLKWRQVERIGQRLIRDLLQTISRLGR